MSKRVLVSAPQLARREAVFKLYRDLGPSRSYQRLLTTLRDTPHGDVSARTLNNWSRDHNWKARLREHDDRLSQASITMPDELGPDFDIDDALEKATKMALLRILKSPMNNLTKPSEFKQVLDAALSALKMLESRRSDRAAKAQGDGSNRKIAEIIDLVEGRIRLAHKLEAEAKAKGIIIEGDAVDVTPPKTPALPAPRPEDRIAGT